MHKTSCVYAESYCRHLGKRHDIDEALCFNIHIKPDIISTLDFSIAPLFLLFFTTSNKVQKPDVHLPSWVCSFQKLALMF